MLKISRKSILATIVGIGIIISFLSTKMLVLARENFDINGDSCKTLISHEAPCESKAVEPAITEETSTENLCALGYDENFIIELKEDDTCKKITLKEYLIMVVMSEMPYTYESEALKAQAIAARTYTLKMFEDGTRHNSNTVCSDPSHCSAGLDREAYIAKYGEAAYDKAYTKVSQAVSATDGVVVTYNGELCTTVYHASSDGATENSYNLWGTYTPYLLSVSTTESFTPQVVEFTPDSFSKLVFGKSLDVGKIDIITNDTGRCEKIVVGTIEVKASKLRSLLGLKSCDFVLTQNSGAITFTVYGYGHGIGMSQNGANEMAKDGDDYTRILTHYYTGVEIEILA